jgi:phage tail sheath protein FI
MPEYLSPGVYIEELPGPQPIQGVSTSTTGMVGVTQKGPTTGKPVLVTSFAEFRAQFGGFLAEPDDAERLSWELDDQEGGFWWRFPNAVKGFFDNGGRRLFVKRVVSSQATAAEVEIPSSVVAARPPDVRTDPLRLEPPAGPGPAPAALLRAVAKARGGWGNDISVRVRPGRARRIQAVHESGTGPIATTLAAELPRDGTSAVIRWTGRLQDVAGPVVVLIGGERFTVANVPPPANDRATLTLDHPSPTRWLSGTAVKILRVVDDGAAAPGPVTVPLARTSDEAVYQGALVVVGQGEARATVTDVVAPPAPPPQGPWPPGSVRLTAVAGGAIPRVFETDLVVVVEAVVDVRYEAGASNPADQREEPEVTTETFSGLRLHPALRGHPRSLVDVVNAESNLVSLQLIETDQMPAVTWDLFPGRRSDEEDGELPLENGGDALDDLSPLDFVGEDLGSGRRSGIQALEDIEEISICVVPGMWSRTVQGALLAHCERLKDRFAVLDAQRGLGVQGVQAFREPLDSAYAALYHPWLRVRDPVTARDVPVPPSGHVAGLYALTDVERGVHKAPANVVIQQIADLDDDINQREQDLLNPVGINALREFPNRGRRVWGARTLSSIPEWRYVNVRRLFLFIEDSIKQGTQWVVFEPNGEPLWALVVQAVTNFLDTVWRTGALQGLRQEEAFYVRADRSTMTQDDIDNGRLVVEIGIAPVRPAEFVIFRFRQKTREQVAVA